MRLYKQKIADDKLAEEKRLEQIEYDNLNKRKQLRVSQLQEFGFTFEYNTRCHKYEDLVVSAVDVAEQSEADWIDIIKILQERVDGLLSLKLLAKRLQEDADRMEIANKAIADKQLADERAAHQAQEALSTASDEVKWESYINQLKMIVYPPFESRMYREMVAIANEKIAEIITLNK